MPECRSCAAPVRWVTMEPSGKANPLDAEPVENGNIEVYVDKGQEMGRVVDPNEGRLFATLLYVSHFSTCPQSSDWRRK